MTNEEALIILEDLYTRKISSIEYVTKKQKQNNQKECEAIKMAIDLLKN